MAYYKRVFAKVCKYKGTTFRSHLERDFAKYLEKQKLQWEYEKYKFELLERAEYTDQIDGKKHILRGIFYTPDFYLPEFDLIIEIKGTWFDKRLFNLKLQLFKRKYPERKFIVIKSRAEFHKIKEAINKIKANKEEEGNGQRGNG